jgi:purine nucleosidase
VNLRRRLPATLFFIALASGVLHAQRLVLIDQDGSGPGGSNQMAMMVLLQSPDVRVLGITMVSGNAWEPEEVAHTLRMLELIHRTDVPVAPGAVFPLLRTEAESKLEAKLYGSFPWYGAWGDLAAHTSMQPYHGPFEVPALSEGPPATKPLTEDAAHFLIRQVHAHPHEVTIYAAGPLTNIALALSIDPEFATLTKGITDRRPGVCDPSAPRVQLLVRPRSRAHRLPRALASHRSHHGRHFSED